MRSLPHIAIACATVWAGSRFLDRGRRTHSEADVTDGGSSADLPLKSDSAADDSVARPIDYRPVALGALLPDLADRVLRRYVFPGAFRDDDHIFGHTILVHLPMLLSGLHLARRGDPRLLAVGIAPFTHLLVDPVIRAPRTLFWPLLGLEFPYVRGLGRSLTLATQAAAALVIVRTMLVVWKAGRLPRFLRTGQL